ncbi:MAG: electron transfer flavoprotein subunit alpha/FixB family protein [Armatimonadetes bacterium]|nr:electron transfer flavoprotein subunit alpha/FixB family protein [Armatimonadota bacterium]
MGKDVWVLVDHEAGAVRRITLELLGKAREIATALGGRAGAVLIGPSRDDTNTKLAAHGADVVLRAEGDGLGAYTTEAWTAVVSDAFRAHAPAALLVPSTAWGRDCAPRIAARLGAGIVTDVEDLAWETDHLVARRPMYTRKILATVALSGDGPQIAVVLPKVFPLPDAASDRVAEQVALPGRTSDREPRVRVLGRHEIKRERASLSEADIVISGGRGLRAPENFALLDGLAATLNGAVGSSRPPVDSGWVPHEYEIGQTGKTVSPTVYVAVGISGAPQHLAGMSGSKFIIAINKDQNAPIFQVASLGVVGDLFAIVPKLTDEIGKAKAAT